MRVLLADKLSPCATEELGALGFEIHTDPALSGDSLASELRSFDPEVLVVRSTKVQAMHIEAGRGLSLVVRAGAGVNTIDLDAASNAGVFVANCPGRNAVAVAELTMGLLLALDRHVADNVMDLRAGRWNKARYSKATGLKGRRLGILGMGKIGQAVAKRAQAFEMEVSAWSRSLTAERAHSLGVSYCDTPTDLARCSDVVTAHLAMNSDTEHLIDASFLKAMPDHGVILNTSRAGIIDEAALLEVLDERGFVAGLDVFDGEPTHKEGAFDHPLAAHASVYGTHHIGASTQEAQTSVANAVVEILRTFRDEGRVVNGVNMATKSHATHSLVVRHHDQVGVLASVLDHLKTHAVNVQEMENLLFEGGHAACARIKIHGQLSASSIEELRDLPHVLNVALVPVPALT
jgi:D-3-phosphoglycerate dehydrogenase